MHVNSILQWFALFPIGASELSSLFRSHYYRLCDAVSNQDAVITRLADILYGSDLVSNETRLAVQHTLGLPPYDRATKLLNAAVTVAQDSVEKAQKFCGCLKECGVPVPERILQGKIAMWLSFTYYTMQLVLIKHKLKCCTVIWEIFVWNIFVCKIVLKYFHRSCNPRKLYARKFINI